MDHQPGDERPGGVFSEAWLRSRASTVAIAGTWAVAAYFLAFMVYHSIWGPPSGEHNWLLALLASHYAACIGVPMSAVSCACIVLLLKATAGPIEFEALGFKFRGASGPVVLWIFCFLSMVYAIWLLWSLK